MTLSKPLHKDNIIRLRLHGKLAIGTFTIPHILRKLLRFGETCGCAQPLAADSIFIVRPVDASRVLDCLSHMTRVFVPVISTSISFSVSLYITF